MNNAFFDMLAIIIRDKDVLVNFQIHTFVKIC